MVASVAVSMRQPRLKMEEGAPVAFYHCVSRVVDRNFVLNSGSVFIFFQP